MSYWKGKRKGLKTVAVFTKDNQVFFKRETFDLMSSTNIEWYPINFKWIPVLENSEK